MTNIQYMLNENHNKKSMCVNYTTLPLVRSHFTPQMAEESDKLKYKYMFFLIHQNNINSMNTI